ncbi:MAG: N-substituted formamide deformylase precursor [Bacteroidetes bacterium ADurb.Bin408]|nr:MAG: N-substituted formamide deformylase precursor [Bacteroidetes bacterium ADurb.Bin408]
MKHIFYFILLMTMLSCTPNGKQKADLIVTHARVYTCDSAFSITESFAVSKGCIVATGTTANILMAYTSDNILDAGGLPIYPGFIDAHAHFTGYGLKMLTVADLSGAESYEAMLGLLSIHDENYKQPWVQGRGWDQNKWPGKQFPDNKTLDTLFPEKPVYLTRVDGHAALVNSKALQLAGITAQTKVNGGDILLKDGRPTGVLIDNAMELVRRIIPPPAEDIRAKALLAAEEKCFGVGLTTVCDAGLPYSDLMFIDSLQKQNKLRIRLYVMLEPEEKNTANIIEKGIYRTARLHACAIKLYADGALGSRGACLLKPYSDAPEHYGLMVTSADSLARCCALAYEKGFQVCTHAIGDAANRTMLKVYASFLKGPNDRRWRIEHAQVVDAADLETFAKFNIIPSVQTTHATSDMYWAEERLGTDRIKQAYAYKALLEQNGWLCNGTDFPIEDINPIISFYAAVVRKDLSGFPAGGFLSGNKLSRQQALLAMTLWAARACFEEDAKGSIEPGKFADFVVLSKDIMQVPEDSLPATQVKATYLSGMKVFGKYKLRKL